MKRSRKPALQSKEATSSAQHSQSAYDAMPYTTYAFPQCDPKRIFCAAKLFGIEAADPATARVLEIGCASGGNIIPLAARMPHAHFLGIDLSPRQIELGQARIASMGLTNISLRCENVRDFRADAQGFAYIICHGVYSWVPSDTQTDIFRVCRAGLARNGVAFVSYNTYPGWKTREILRDAMMFHTQAISDPREKLAHGRGMVDYMRGLSGATSMFAHILQEESGLVRNGADDYIVHEHLERDNHPCYFHEFAKRAADQGLAYLADTTLATMFAENLGSEMHQRLVTASGGSQIMLEQYLDFASNRAFRQSLLVRDDDSSVIDRRIDHRTLRRFAYRGLFQRERAETTEAGVTFRSTSGGFVTSNEPVEIEVLHYMSGTEGVHSWDSLRAAISPQTETAAQTIDARLNGLLSRLIVAGLVEMFSAPMAMHPSTFDRPAVDPVLHRLARNDTVIVANALHEPVILTPAQRILLPLMDGTVDRTTMRRALADAVADKRLFFWQGNEPILEADAVWQMTQTILDQALHAFSQGRLLNASLDTLAA